MKPVTTPSVLAPMLAVDGKLCAEEARVVRAGVAGAISHRASRLTIGERGRVMANIHAAIIVIEGTVQGDLVGDEAVVIKRTGTVTGRVTAPRIMIEAGATLNGRIDTKPTDAGPSRGEA